MSGNRHDLSLRVRRCMDCSQKVLDLRSDIWVHVPTDRESGLLRDAGRVVAWGLLC